MQKTKLLLNILAFFLCALPAMSVAQGGGNVTVRGIVTSADDKQPLIGVNVISGHQRGEHPCGRKLLDQRRRRDDAHLPVHRLQARHLYGSGRQHLADLQRLPRERGTGARRRGGHRLRCPQEGHHRRIGIDRQGRKGREHPYGGVRSGHPGTGSRTDGTFQFG